MAGGEALRLGRPPSLQPEPRDQIALGQAEGLPPAGIRATVFPWTQRWSYASALQDKLAAVVSFGGFGRRKVVRSFQRPALEADRRLPTVYEVRWR